MTRRATLADDLLLTWESQVYQYRDAEPPAEIPGYSYYAGVLETGTVDCLLWWGRTTSGRPMIVGILNHYPVDMPPFERAGAVNVWVRRTHQRRGIGGALVRLANALYGPIDYDRQRYTAAGAALAESIERDEIMRLDSEGKRIPEGWTQEEWERLTSQERTHFRAGIGFGQYDDENES